jgi:hypothetical protein
MSTSQLKEFGSTRPSSRRSPPTACGPFWWAIGQPPAGPTHSDHHLPVS